MKPQDNTGTSKFISRILRHHPESIGIQLDEHGWARVDELIAGIAKTRKFDMEMLEEIVRTDSKQRYSFNENKTLIRANQGHSIHVDVELEQKIPPQELRMLLHRSPRQRAYRVHRQEVPVPYNMCNHLLPLPYNMSHQGLHRGQHLMEASTVLLSMQGNTHLHL